MINFQKRKHKYTQVLISSTYSRVSAIDRANGYFYVKQDIDGETVDTRLRIKDYFDKNMERYDVCQNKKYVLMEGLYLNILFVHNNISDKDKVEIHLSNIKHITLQQKKAIHKKALKRAKALRAIYALQEQKNGGKNGINVG